MFYVRSKVSWVWWECGLAAISQTTTHMHTGIMRRLYVRGWGELGSREGLASSELYL